MPDITIDAKALTGVASLDGADWYIKRIPFEGSHTSQFLLSKKVIQGVLDDNGRAVVTLPTSPTGTRYVLVIREHGAWEFNCWHSKRRYS